MTEQDPLFIEEAGRLLSDAIESIEAARTLTEAVPRTGYEALMVGKHTRRARSSVRALAEVIRDLRDARLADS